MTFDEARAQFPVLDEIAYLNAGSMGPFPRAAAEAMQEVEARELRRGRGGRPYIDEMLRLRDGFRTRIATLLGVDASQIALTSSTTDGCQIVLAGLDLGPDDEVVTTDAEHPGLLAPLHATGAKVVVAPTSAQPADAALDVLLAAVSERTRLLALSHVCWTTGQVFPVHELKRETGLPIIVDGAQSVGAVRVEVGALDWYTVSGQKWLCGPAPLGALYVADPERLRVARPTYFSQQRIGKDGAFEPQPGARRFDSGWIAVPSLAAMVAALDCAPEWRFEHAHAVAERCRDALGAAGFELVTEAGQATLVSFRPRDDDEPAAAAARAYDAGVVIRELPGTGWLRASCGWWTSDEDVRRLVAALA